MHPLVAPPSPLLRSVMRRSRPHAPASGTGGPLSLQRLSLHGTAALHNNNNDKAANTTREAPNSDTYTPIRSPSTDEPPKPQAALSDEKYKPGWKNAFGIIRIIVGLKVFLYLLWISSMFAAGVYVGLQQNWEQDWAALYSSLEGARLIKGNGGLPP